MGKVILLRPNASASSGPVPPASDLLTTPEARRAAGLALRAAMRLHGCSNEMLGRAAGVSRQAVQRWCAGEVMVPEARLDAAMANPRCRRVVEAYRARLAGEREAA
jgi:hypothetical protein